MCRSYFSPGTGLEIDSFRNRKYSDRKVTGVSTFSLEGTWTYAGPDCKFESDNVLAKVGSEIAAQKVETEMTNILSKIGFKEGVTYTFNADGTYSSTVNGRTTQGTYTYDSETNELALKTN